jgi:hypothetical protein
MANLRARSAFFTKAVHLEGEAMRRSVIAVAIVAGTLVGDFGTRNAAAQEGLRSPDAFSGIADRGGRSRALFGEMAKVITGPRCMNCHPAGDHPLQDDDQHIHMPTAFRGDANAGVPGLPCASCHTDHNFTLTAGAASYQSIPGHPRWSLAPPEMAWEGKSVSEICRQIKDPARNGGRTLALLHDHIAKDDLVAWAWNPGPGRKPAPGTQQQLGQLVQAWIDTGAECPQ